MISSTYGNLIEKVNKINNLALVYALACARILRIIKELITY